MLTDTRVFFNTKDMCRLLGVTRHTLAAAVKKGAVPKPIKLSKRTFRWKASDVEDWAKPCRTARH